MITRSLASSSPSFPKGCSRTTSVTKQSFCIVFLCELAIPEFCESAVICPRAADSESFNSISSDQVTFLLHQRLSLVHCFADVLFRLAHPYQAKKKKKMETSQVEFAIPLFILSMSLVQRFVCGIYHMSSTTSNINLLLKSRVILMSISQRHLYTLRTYYSTKLWYLMIDDAGGLIKANCT